MIEINIARLILFVEIHHINKLCRHHIEQGWTSVYDVCFNNVHHRYRRQYEGLIRKGYSMVFRHEGKQKLLIFNKKYYQYYARPHYQQRYV